VRKLTQWTIGLVISAAALALAFRGVRLAEMAEALQRARYIYILPTLALFLVGLLARALSWQVILGGRVAFWRAFTALNEGYFLSNVLPFRLGELGRAYLVSRNHDLSTTRALSSVLVERVIDLCMIVVLFVTVLPQVLGLAWAREAALVAGLLSAAAIGGLLALTHNRALTLRLTRSVFGRIRFAWFSATRWEKRMAALLDGMEAVRDWRRLALAACGSALAWISASVGAWVLLFAFFPAPTLPMGFFVLIISGLGVALPSAPAAVGVFEASTVAALSAFGIEGSAAFTYALTYHALHFGITCLIGAIALAREGETLTHLAQAAQALMSGEAREAIPQALERSNNGPPPTTHDDYEAISEALFESQSDALK